MPRFYFNSRTGEDVIADSEGEVLSGVAAAERVARRDAEECLIEAIKTKRTPPDSIQVVDHEGREVCRVLTADILRR